MCGNFRVIICNFVRVVVWFSHSVFLKLYSGFVQFLKGRRVVFIVIGWFLRLLISFLSDMNNFWVCFKSCILVF